MKSKAFRDYHPGEPTGFLPGEAFGAWPLGTRVVKVHSQLGDGHADGAPGRIVASHCVGDGEYFYFVVWDDTPEVAVGIMGVRLGKEAA